MRTAYWLIHPFLQGRIELLGFGAKTSTSRSVNRTSSGRDAVLSAVRKLPPGVLSVMPALARTSALRPRAINSVVIPARASTPPKVPPIAPAPMITYRWSS